MIVGLSVVRERDTTLRIEFRARANAVAERCGRVYAKPPVRDLFPSANPSARSPNRRVLNGRSIDLQSRDHPRENRVRLSTVHDDSLTNTYSRRLHFRSNGAAAALRAQHTVNLPRNRRMRAVYDAQKDFLLRVRSK